MHGLRDWTQNPTCAVQAAAACSEVMSVAVCIICVYEECQSSVRLCTDVLGGQEHTNLDVVNEVFCRSVLSGAVGGGCSLIGLPL